MLQSNRRFVPLTVWDAEIIVDGIGEPKLGGGRILFSPICCWHFFDAIVEKSHFLDEGDNQPGPVKTFNVVLQARVAQLIACQLAVLEI